MVPGMIDKDYFKRQARTLRKMVRVAQDRTVADRLSDMADDFDARANDGSTRLEPATVRHGVARVATRGRASARDPGRKQKGRPVRRPSDRS